MILLRDTDMVTRLFQCRDCGRKLTSDDVAYSRGSFLCVPCIKAHPGTDLYRELKELEGQKRLPL